MKSQKGLQILLRPSGFRSKVSFASRHSSTSWPRADRSRSHTCIESEQRAEISHARRDIPLGRCRLRRA